MDAFIRELVAEVGAAAVITDPELIAPYASDETAGLSARPAAVVRAATTDDVSRTLALCYRHRMAVTPRGAGTGVTGGAVAVQGGIILSLEKMNRIIEIDRHNMTALVEPGVITGDLQRAVRDVGLMYPPDPASLDSCSIGGNVAENAGGPGAVKYGTTSAYVLGLQCVLPDGAVIFTGGKTVKNVTGLNLTGIIVGSEGTLAVATQILLRLIPLPPCSRDLLIPFPSIREAAEGVTAIIGSGITPAAIEFMEANTLTIVRQYLGGAMPFPDAGAHLLIRLDGTSDESVISDMERLAAALSVDPETILVAENDTQRERLWKARRSIRDAIRAASAVFFAEDCVVPRAAIPDFLDALTALLAPRGVPFVMFGHAGDGNIHLNILKGEMEIDQWNLMVPELKREIYLRALALGGAITGEHGIGFTRRSYLPLALSPDEIALSRRIKNAFDPRGILNPGKIFPDDGEIE
jgi:glycolate oxidase